jgi:ABC-type polysaccharide/polyol phosphate export permease
LAFTLTWREVLVRYKRSVLGLGWALAEPLALGFVYFVVIGRFAGVRIPNYGFYLLAGLFPWTYLQGACAHCATVMIDNAPIIRKVFFPREILVLSKLGSQGLTFLVSLVLLLAAAWLGGGLPLGWHTLWVLPALGWLLLLTAAVGGLVAVLGPYARDVPHLMQFAFRLGTYATPIIYQPSMVPPEWRWGLALNPASGMVELFHRGILGPSHPLDPALCGGSALSCLVCVCAGLWVFRRLEPRISEVV